MQNVVEPTLVAMAGEVWARRGDPVAFQLVVSLVDWPSDYFS